MYGYSKGVKISEKSSLFTSTPSYPNSRLTSNTRRYPRKTLLEMHPRVVRLSRRIFYVIGLFVLAECLRVVIHDLQESDIDDLDDEGLSAMGSWGKVDRRARTRMQTTMKPKTPSCDSVEYGYQCQSEISHLWGQYSPWYSVPSEISAETPKNCRINFAQILARHGARDPTAFRTITYNVTLTRIQTTVKEFKGNYTFLQDYIYLLGADQLTQFGEAELVNAGRKFYERYTKLARTQTPFIRAGGQDRVVRSAAMFAKGFHVAKASDKDAKGRVNYPYDILIIPETETSNNTLSNDLCPIYRHGEYAHYGSEHQNLFAKTFVPAITARLNNDLPGADLIDAETIILMDMCPFDTVATPNATPLSPFCNLFSLEEWEKYDYYQTIGKFYGYGPGNPMAPTQGVGFVNELISRLTHEPVNDHTSTNSTLDENPETFPIDGKISLYADFSHDNDMTTIFSALGLYNSTTPPSTSEMTPSSELDGYSAGGTVPFAGRMVVEKLECKGEEEEMVRVLINDRVMRLRSCEEGNGHYGKKRMCTVSKFVESLSFARQGGFWDRCWV